MADAREASMIESNIPIPKPKNTRRGGMVVPGVFLADLNVGDSFSAGILTPAEYNSLRQRVHCQSIALGIKCAIRKLPDETRCWRVS
jgi:hypothetical protein